MTIGERIHNRRLEVGLSVDELAKKLGKNRATVYRYESDDIQNLHQMQRIRTRNHYCIRTGVRTLNTI